MIAQSHVLVNFSTTPTCVSALLRFGETYIFKDQNVFVGWNSVDVKFSITASVFHWVPTYFDGKVAGLLTQSRLDMIRTVFRLKLFRIDDIQ